jgi:hypothetical protein
LIFVPIINDAQFASPINFSFPLHKAK